MNGLEGLLAGRTLAERYRIDGVIGRGGMGVVYCATDLRLGRAVAVKVITANAATPAAQQTLRERFHREARAAAGIRHPNVVAVFDYGTDAALGLDFLVMELLRGEDLAARLARCGPPPPEVALGILTGAARGLAAGHRAGLIHRDVKPGNLYLEPGDGTGEMVVKVLDFGIVEMAGEDEATRTQLTRFGSAPLSPAYASPEQLRGDTRLSPASDVFSLGAVGYHLLTGERAFASTEPRRMSGELSASLASLYAHTPLLAPPVRATLARALSHEPAARFRDAGELAEALAAAHAEWTGRPAPRAPPRPAPAATRVPPEEPTRWLPTESPVREQPRPAASWPAPSGAAVPGPVRTEIRVERRRGFAYFLRRTWDLLVTAVSLALGGGMWYLAIHGAMYGNPWEMYGGVVGSTVFTPLAVLRVAGTRWRFPLALLVSIVATAGVLALVGLDAEPGKLLALTLGAQFLASAAVAGVGLPRPSGPLPGT